MVRVSLSYVINDTSCESDYNHETKKIKRKSLMNTLHEEAGMPLPNDHITQQDY